jgi:hypothetical protein
LFGDEQKETGATPKIEDLLGIRSIKSEPSRTGKISFQPALYLGVFHVNGSRRRVAVLNIAEAIFVELVQKSMNAP